MHFILFPVSQSFHCIQEEETYANAIIEAFEKGAIQGCKNGCTLRAYLSRNLHCQPMRISKKYAGKAIGKQVFLSRLNVASERSMGSSNTEVLKQLEFQFHMSVVQEGMCSDNAAAHHQKNAIVNGHGVAINPFFSGWHQQGHQSHHQQQTSSNVSEALLSNIPKYFNISCLHVHTLYSRQNVSEITFIRQPISVEAAVIESTPTTFQAARSIVPSGKTSSATVETNTETEGGDHANYTNTSTNNKNSQAQMNFVTSQIHQNLFSAFKQAQTSYPGTNNLQNSEQNKHANEQYQSNSQNDSSSTGGLNSGQAQQNWINETMAMIPTLDSSNYNTGRSTPTYTSKSFDDLHQLIGKDLPNTRSASSEIKEKQTINMVGPATDATNKMAMKDQMHATTATHHQNMRLDQINFPVMNGNEVVFAHASDEYAYFAKQSIIDASKHSAYSTFPRHHPQPKEIPQIRSDTPIVSHADNVRNNLGPPPSRPMKFNKVNVKLHSKCKENKKIDAVLQGNPSLPLTLDSQSSERVSNCNSIPAIHRHTPVVSASEGTDRSAESSLMGGFSSRSSGSDDNSDSASDEGQGLSLEQSKKRKVLHMEGSTAPSKIGKK